MAVSLDLLITDLRREYGDDISDQERNLSDEHLRRAISRAVVVVNRDFGSGYQVQADTVSPDPSEPDLEMILLCAMVNVSEMQLARFARYPSVKSGDKSVSHSDQVDAWSRLHTRYLEQYRDAVASYKANRLEEVEPKLYG